MYIGPVLSAITIGLGVKCSLDLHWSDHQMSLKAKSSAGCVITFLMMKSDIIFRGSAWVIY